MQLAITMTKFGFFWNEDIEGVIRDEDEHQITSDLKHNEVQNEFKITLIYGKSNDYLRGPLWDKFIQQDNSDDKPLCTVGDFNIITIREEKMRGVPYNMKKRFEFISIIEVCEVIVPRFSGLRFTQCNQWHCPKNNENVQQVLR